MEDHLIALQFGEDMMRYALETLSIHWEKPVSRYYEGLCPFNEEIGDAVLGIVNHNVPDIYGCFKDLTEMGAGRVNIYSRLAFEAAPTYFAEGYSHENLLCYCAMLVGVARLMHSPSNGIAEATAEVIGSVLVGHVLTGEFYRQGGYDQLTEVSEIFARNLAM